MSATHVIAVTTTTFALPLLLAAPAGALQVSEPAAVVSTSTGVPTPPGFMGRPGWVSP